MDDQQRQALAHAIRDAHTTPIAPDGDEGAMLSDLGELFNWFGPFLPPATRLAVAASEGGRDTSQLRTDTDRMIRYLMTFGAALDILAEGQS